MADPRSRPEIEELAKQKVLSSGGEVGALMRSMDWSQTGLGPVSSWPQSLRTAVSICLHSRFELFVWWGPELIMLYNDAYRQTLQSKHPWALGKPGNVVWSEIWPVIGPMLHDVLRTGEATWSDDLLLFLERHGYPEETYHTFSYSPIIDEDGDISGVFTAVTQTTDKVIGERRLRTLRDVAARSADAISESEAWSTVAEVLSNNPYDVQFAAMYRFDIQQEVAETIAFAGIAADHPFLPDSIPLRGDDSTDGCACYVREALRSAKTVEISNAHELGFELPGGAWDEQPSEVLFLPLIQTGQAQPLGILLAGVSRRKRLDENYRGFFNILSGQISKSISDAQAFEKERKRAEALAEIDRAKTAFFSNVSHEFRTPLTLMLGPLEDTLAEGALQLGRDNADRLQTVHRNGMRLLKLVNSLLDFSRIEAGRMQAVYEAVDLAAVSAELASVFRSTVERAGLHLRLELDRISEPIYVDQEMWEKIVLNLLSNAFKFTFNGGIEVKLTESDSAVQFVVRDTGTGIPQEELPRLFERFYRVEGAKGRSFEGSGIGLALVQELVKLHGGSITVQSTPGQGSAFSVTLHKGKAHLAADRIGASRGISTGLRADSYVEEALRWLPDAGYPAITAGDDAALPLVVLVDDNADMRDYAARLLRSEFRVAVASNGQEGLAIVQAGKPDLVLTDIMMPVLDGFGLLNAIRSDASIAGTPVVMLSARAGEEARVEGLQAGADDYLVKPFTARELLARVRAHVSIAKMRREAAEQERRLRREAEAERRKLRELFDQAPAGIGVLSGPDHVWTYVNQRYLQIVARRYKEELLHRTIRESLPELEVQGFIELMDVVYRTGNPYVGSEVGVNLADGKGGFHTLYFDFVYQPMRDADNAVESILVHCIEVTDRVLGRREVERKQELLRAALAASSTGTFRWDPATGHFHDFDDNLKELFGIAAAEPVELAQTAAVRLHKEDRGAFLAQLEHCRSGHDFDMDFRVELPGGRVRWLYGRAKMQHTNGASAQLVGACTDITSTRELAEQLRTLNEIGRRVAAELDQQKLLQLITDAATQGTGAQFGAFFQNVEDERGSSYLLYTISGVDRSNFSKFPMPRNTEIFAPTFAGEGTVRSANIRLDPRFGHNAPYQGTPPEHLPVVSYLAVSVKGKEGRTIGGLFFGHSGEGIFSERDERFAEAIASHASVALENSRLYRAAQEELEQRRKVEAELEQQRSFLAMAQKSGHIGSWQLDLKSDPLRATWSEELEALYGFAPGTFGGRYENWLAVVHPDDREPASGSLMRSIERHEPWVAEFRIVRQDGETRHMSARAQCHYDDSGTPVLMIGVNIDITERKRAEDALRNSEKLAATGRLAATIAHEINNPLEAVINFIFLARRNPGIPDSASKHLELADRELERVSHIAQQTLGFYRDTSAPVTVNIQKSIQDVLRLFERKLKYKLIEVDVDVPPGLEIQGLRGEVRQVLSNLLANAIDASHKQGSIRLRARNVKQNGQDFIRIAIADHGHGISLATRQHIFQPFFTTKKDVGTGLGLWVTKSMVEKHGGRIAFRSAQGRGTVFVVTFPRHMPQPPQQQLPAV
jgi:PAS domain S-box-containing protein